MSFFVFFIMTISNIFFDFNFGFIFALSVFNFFILYLIHNKFIYFIKLKKFDKIFFSEIYFLISLRKILTKFYPILNLSGKKVLSTLPATVLP